MSRLASTSKKISPFIKLALITTSVLPNIAMSRTLDLDNSRAGVRLSSIDLDDTAYDDTVGLNAFLEAPFDPRTSFGIATEFWSTEGRYTQGRNLSDIALSGYAKYYLGSLAGSDITPYGVAGVGLHQITRDKALKFDTSRTSGSFDLGIGFEAKVTDYIAMNGEMKFHNVDNHDYNDYGLGLIAKF